MHLGQIVRTWVLQIARGYLFASGNWVSRNSLGGDDAAAQQ
jgi:hypothetical protein